MTPQEQALLRARAMEQLYAPPRRRKPWEGINTTVNVPSTNYVQHIGSSMPAPVAVPHFDINRNSVTQPVPSSEAHMRQNTHHVTKIPKNLMHEIKPIDTKVQPIKKKKI